MWVLELKELEEKMKKGTTHWFYIHAYIHTYIRLFKAFKNKINIYKECFEKGSLRGWPYVKNSQKKNVKNISEKESSVR